MKTLINILMLSLSIFTYGQTYLVNQHFSSVAPTGWSSTSSTWSFVRNESATGNYRNVFDATKYSSRFSSAANGNSIYIYIPINFKQDSVYTITFYTKRVCSVEINTNELPNQTTLLSNQLLSNSSCSSNWNVWYQWSTTLQSNYTGAGYFQIWAKTIYGGPTSAYLDDVTILESSPVGLPIELLYFKGVPSENHNHITWSTASEHNNNYFDIETTIDGIEYHSITRLSGSGNSQTKIDYEFDDYNIDNGISYYRLKQTDYDGKFRYSDLISIDNRIKPKIVSRMVSLMGTEVNEMYRGIVIVEYTDGSIEKIIR